MPTQGANVCCSGKTGIGWGRGRLARLTQPDADLPWLTRSIEVTLGVQSGPGSRNDGAKSVQGRSLVRPHAPPQEALPAPFSRGAISHCLLTASGRPGRSNLYLTLRSPAHVQRSRGSWQVGGLVRLFTAWLIQPFLSNTSETWPSACL